MLSSNNRDSGKLKDMLTTIPLLSDKELDTLIEQALEDKKRRGRKNIDTIRLS